MSDLEMWPHKWFGLWREYGPGYSDFPSIVQFRAPEIVAGYDKKRLCEYLRDGQVIASTSRANFPCPFTGKMQSGSISFRTDGEWVWLDDLADYVDQFDVAIPLAWVKAIVDRNYKFDPVDEDAMLSLDWPPFAP